MRPLLLLAFACLLPGPAAGAGPEVLAVIVPQHAGSHVPAQQELALIFNRKKLNWADGSRIRPVNLPADHPWRREFSLRVLKSLPEAQTQHWNSLYYHGVFPPHVVASPEAMLRFVAETDGAVGYVSACSVDARVRPVLWVTPGGGITAAAPALDCKGD